MEEDIDEVEIPSLLQEALDTPRDRLFILRIEQGFLSFIKDPQRSSDELDEMNSYQRLIAHTIADYYCLRHVVSGSSIIVSKLPDTRIPPRQLHAIIQASSDQRQQQQQEQQQHNRIKLMKRLKDSERGSETSSVSQSSASSPSDPSPDPQSLQERAAAYEKAKARIFKGFLQDEVLDNKEADILNGNHNGLLVPDFPLRSQYVPLNNGQSHAYFNRLGPADSHFGYAPPDNYSCSNSIRTSPATFNRQQAHIPNLSNNPVFPSAAPPPHHPHPQYLANNNQARYMQPTPPPPWNGYAMMTDPSGGAGFTNNAFTQGYWNSGYRPPRP